LKFIRGGYSMKLFKHDLILNFCKNKKVLHIGAVDSPYHLERFNNGTLLHLKLQKNCKEVVGIDVDKKAIKELENLGIDNIFYGDVCEDSYEVNLKAMRFDYIVFSDVIEHLDNPGLALANIKKIMEKDTELILTTPNVFSYTNIMTHITGKENVHPDHTFQPSYKTMCKLFGNNDLKIDYFTYCFWGSHEESNTWKMRLFCKLIANRRKYIMPVLFFILEVK